MGNQLMVIDQGNSIGSLEPIGHLTIRDDENMAVFRKELFKCPQAKSQLVVVAVATFNIAKLGKTQIAGCF